VTGTNEGGWRPETDNKWLKLAGSGRQVIVDAQKRPILAIAGPDHVRSIST
jgi:hypothetical protein